MMLNHKIQEMEREMNKKLIYGGDETDEQEKRKFKEIDCKTAELPPPPADEMLENIYLLNKKHLFDIHFFSSCE